MKLRLRLCWILCLFFGLQASELAAQKLDIFNTTDPFSIDLLAEEVRTINLEKLDEKEIPSILKVYLKTEESTENRDTRNLLALATGYLYARNGDYRKGYHHLNKNIIGNFILEDFRLHFKATALMAVADQYVENKKYPEAIGALKKSIQFLLSLYRSYPDSPFHADVPMDLARAERLLGDANLNRKNYRSAWQAYRRSLMRQFPENELHRSQVMLSLAATYRSAGELGHAADILAFLLKKYDSPEVREAAMQFVRENEKKLRRKGIQLKALWPAKPSAKKTQNNKGDSLDAEDLMDPQEVQYQNEAVKNFYASLGKRNPVPSLELGMEVLKNYPGITESRGVIQEINRLIRSILKHQPRNTVIEAIADLYPAKDLNSIGLALWRDGLSEQAAFFYEKILVKYPLDKIACHKAIFFLGRIWEDLGNLTQSMEKYQQLFEKYDFGPYTTSALFKIPWIERIEKKYESAKEHFEEFLNFLRSKTYKELSASFPNSSSYTAATYYWLAQTEGDLGNQQKKKQWLKKLVDDYPFDFYSIFSLEELGLSLKEFFARQTSQVIAYRKFGLGEIERKRLRRAEKLIAVGFWDSGERELAQLTTRKSDPAFLFYLSRLFHHAGGFQRSIQLSWDISRRDGHKGLSRDLAEVLFPRAYLDNAVAAARQYHLDPWLVVSLMRQESAFNPEIVSSATAMGLMQLLPQTAAEVARSMNQEAPSPEQLTDPDTNIRLGTEYLNHLLSIFDRNIIYSLAAYNAGPAKVRAWVELRKHLSPLEFMESIPYFETRGYVKKVLRNYAIYLSLYQDKRVKGLKDLLTISSD